MLLHYPDGCRLITSLPVDGSSYLVLYQELTLPKGLVNISGSVEVTSENAFPVGVGRWIQTGTGVLVQRQMVEDVVQGDQHHMIVPYYGAVDHPGGAINLCFYLYGQCSQAAQPLSVDYMDIYITVAQTA